MTDSSIGVGTLVSEKDKKLRQQEALNLLSQIFQQPKHPEFVPQLLELLIRTNLWIDDPLFLLVGSILGWEKLVEEAPQDLEQKLKAWSESLDERLANLDLTLVKKQELAIAAAAKELIKTQKSQEQLSVVKAVLPAGLSLVLMFTIGIVTGGIITYWNFQKSIAPGSPKLMTVEEVKALEWAQSESGKFAKQLMEWNQGWLDNRQCEGETQKLGVKMQQNTRIAESGFCVVWTQPPEKRVFQK